MASQNSVSSVQPIAFTVGHSTRPIEEFIGLLAIANISCLVDVRTLPRSRTNPQFNKETLPASLAAAEISYVHMPELGGLRKPRKDSPNGGWRNSSFRGYADYMQTAEFARAIERLLKLVERDRIALMCAEAVPWRCHRSMIADALSIRGVHVEEIVSRTKHQVHKLTSFAKLDGTTITYPPSDEPAKADESDKQLPLIS